MKNSTIIMVNALGGILGLALGRVIGVLPTIVIAFILGGILTYVNEKYNTLF